MDLRPIQQLENGTARIRIHIVQDVVKDQLQVVLIRPIVAAIVVEELLRHAVLREVVVFLEMNV